MERIKQNSFPIGLKKKFDRSLEQLLAVSGPDALKPTLVALREFHSLATNKTEAQTLDKYSASILNVIKLATQRFGDWIIPVGKRWDGRYDVPHRPTQAIISESSPTNLAPLRLWHDEHDAAFINLAQSIFALLKLIEDLPFDRSDTSQAKLNLLITLKTEVFTNTHKNGSSSIGSWCRSARSNPATWESSAFAAIHRQIDEEIIMVLCSPEAATWDMKDDLEKLRTVEQQTCTFVNRWDSKCICAAMHQPLIRRIGATVMSNCVYECVKGKLPMELADEILAWALLMSGNEVVRDWTALGGFRADAVPMCAHRQSKINCRIFDA